MSPILEACRKNDLLAVEDLLENEGDPNDKDIFGNSCLIFAASYGSYELFKLLFDHGADIHHVDASGKNVYYWAWVNGKGDMLHLLKQYGAKLVVPSVTVQQE